MINFDAVDPITIEDLVPIADPARALYLAGMLAGVGGKITIAEIFSLLEHDDVAGLLAAVDIAFNPAGGPLAATDLQAGLAEAAALIGTSVAARVRHDAAQGLVMAQQKQARANIGALFAGVSLKAANYGIVVADAGSVIAVNASTAARTITLPALIDVGDGFAVAIRKVDATFNAVTITGTIDGVTNKLLRLPDQSVLLVSDNSNGTWRTVAEAGQVITGTVSGASWERYADGRQVCRSVITTTPVANTPTTSTFTYPVVFTSVTGAQVAANSGAPEFVNAAYANLGTSSVDVVIKRTNTVATSLSVSVTGRWYV